ncbi:MAG: hypothetical protein ABGX05_16100, partial [Pirellulaceae bacterium]
MTRPLGSSGNQLWVVEYDCIQSISGVNVLSRSGSYAAAANTLTVLRSKIASSVFLEITYNGQQHRWNPADFKAPAPTILKSTNQIADMINAEFGLQNPDEKFTATDDVETMTLSYPGDDCDSCGDDGLWVRTANGTLLTGQDNSTVANTNNQSEYQLLTLLPEIAGQTDIIQLGLPSATPVRSSVDTVTASNLAAAIDNLLDVDGTTVGRLGSTSRYLVKFPGNKDRGPLTVSPAGAGPVIENQPFATAACWKTGKVPCWSRGAGGKTDEKLTAHWVKTSVPEAKQFKWADTNVAGGDKGEIGGRFSNDGGSRFFADTRLQGVMLDDHLIASGKLKLAGKSGTNFAGSLTLGHFNTGRLTPRSLAVGIAFNGSGADIRWNARLGDQLATSNSTLSSGAVDWSYQWDPTGGTPGNGKLTVTVGAVTQSLEVSAARNSFDGQSLDAFGFAWAEDKTVTDDENIYIDLWIDNAKYTRDQTLSRPYDGLESVMVAPGGGTYIGSPAPNAFIFWGSDYVGASHSSQPGSVYTFANLDKNDQLIWSGFTSAPAARTYNPGMHLVTLDGIPVVIHIDGKYPVTSKTKSTFVLSDADRAKNLLGKGNLWSTTIDDAAAGARTGPVLEHDSGLQGLIDAARGAWEATGLLQGNEELLGNISFQVSNALEDGELATTTENLDGSFTVKLASQAYGHGWFVDTTPFDSVEYLLDPETNVLAAVDPWTGDSATRDTDCAVSVTSLECLDTRYDLYSVVTHEIAHAIGYSHSVASDEPQLLDGQQSTGTRLTLKDHFGRFTPSLDQGLLIEGLTSVRDWFNSESGNAPNFFPDMTIPFVDFDLNSVWSFGGEIIKNGLGGNGGVLPGVNDILSVFDTSETVTIFDLERHSLVSRTNSANPKEFKASLPLSDGAEISLDIDFSYDLLGEFLGLTGRSTGGLTLAADLTLDFVFGEDDDGFYLSDMALVAKARAFHSDPLYVSLQLGPLGIGIEQGRFQFELGAELPFNQVNRVSDLDGSIWNKVSFSPNLTPTSFYDFDFPIYQQGVLRGLQSKPARIYGSYNSGGDLEASVT